MQKKLAVFREASDRSKAPLNGYKCVGGASEVLAKGWNVRLQWSLLNVKDPLWS